MATDRREQDAATMRRKSRDAARLLDFDEKTHQYKLKASSQVVPSVTQLLGEAGYDSWLRYISERDLETARNRGSFAHELTALVDQNALDHYAASQRYPEYMGYVNAWARFRQAADFEPVEIEKLSYSEALGYAGTPDRVGFWRRSPAGSRVPCILDVKTGQFPFSVWLQTMGYAVAQDFPYMERICVLLRADGTYSVEIREAKHWRSDYEQWLRVISSNNYNIANGLRPKWRDHDAK